ncbi:hypothetical protein FT663_00501 [Candidozyma haemuli var. vulneris]|uniref:Phenazine biosynthesis protein PhzF family n=1 Tax=Candidozyma haemuli TaxID=45357 RepID=A0A2V1ARN2_9ASCO|nr:hypothetical protein CXQ85_002235 [[Candida] haemuloni]KAF3993478.1 hypothetical protein FT662_00607 [[Candida] haemuloni var. vulneris]KAF3995448.1 hypothetical protein FT663_00501 [[Candida] haemuloni var. vulneris]PVH20445.1 hypothetical protein CXQ85_002235 [[Candida] haemuloni]
MPPFKQVDVFTTKRYKGNPVAVFFEADDLSSEQMAQMSSWTNLSEATFVLKPTNKDADYKLRIFALEHELPFAGHPTIGTCHALLEAGLIEPKDGKIYQECAAGLVELTVEDGRIKFQLPYAKQLRTPGDITAVTKHLFQDEIKSTSPEAILFDVGPHWLTLRLDSAETVLSLKPNQAGLKQLSEAWGITGVQALGPHKAENTYELRTFCPAVGCDEDPVCGSGSGAAGAFLAASGELKGTINIIQGTNLKREGKVTVTNEDKVTVGGPAITTLEGTWKP